MARRAGYTKVDKSGLNRPAHVEGMGDVVFRGFQCLNPECENFIFVREDVVGSDFAIKCESCGFVHETGEVSVVFEYELKNTADNSVIESGDFEIIHDEYVAEAASFKYCVLCATLKPLSMFSKHATRKSGHQSECRLCKTTYNSIKNQTRIPDQHREASQKRRLMTELTNSPKINIGTIYDRFGHKCFKCDKDLSGDREKGAASLGNLDHTFPAKYLWPLTSNNATLLCKEHNGEKAEKWPGTYYTDAELRRLAPLVGIDYKDLKGPAFFNPEAVDRLRKADFVEKLFVKHARYVDDLIRLRNQILKATKFDFFTSWPKISPDLVERANKLLKP